MVETRAMRDGKYFPIKNLTLIRDAVLCVVNCDERVFFWTRIFLLSFSVLCKMNALALECAMNGKSWKKAGSEV